MGIFPEGLPHFIGKKNGIFRRIIFWLEWNDLHNGRGACSPWLTRKQNVCATPRLTPNIFFLGLIQEDGGIAGHALRELGLETERVQEMVERLAPIGREEPAEIELSVGGQQVLEFAIEEARHSWAPVYRHRTSAACA